MQRRHFMAAATIAVIGDIAHAQTAAPYPARPVRMIVPFPPGGPTDVMGRIAAKAMGEQLGQSCIVENKAGAGGNIGTDAVAKAAPDGYTIGLAAISSLAIAPHLYANLPFNAEKDFAPISLVGTTPCALVVHPGAPFTDLNGLITYAKAHLGQLNYATSGIGTSNHLAAELLQSFTGIQLTHVPYRGSSQIVPDLLSGTIMMSMESSLATTLQHIQAGKLRAIAITSPQRAGALPQVPTVAESGYPGFAIETWFGLVAPAATPQPILQRLATAWATGAKSAEVQTTFDHIAANLRTTDPAQFAAFMRSENQRFGNLIRRTGIKAE